VTGTYIHDVEAVTVHPESLSSNDGFDMMRPAWIPLPVGFDVVGMTRPLLVVVAGVAGAMRCGCAATGCETAANTAAMHNKQVKIGAVIFIMPPFISSFSIAEHLVFRVTFLIFNLINN
jgi:hypothetical protein